MSVYDLIDSRQAKSQRVVAEVLVHAPRRPSRSKDGWSYCALVWINLVPEILER